jgi:two-component system phosphate regulon sensor histidine kinase PhoR
MRKKIIASYIALTVILTMLFAAIMMNSVRDSMTLQFKERFENEALLVKNIFIKAYTLDANLDYEQFVEALNADSETRVTIIDKLGVVLADSIEDPKNMNNHLNRDEISQVVKTGEMGMSIRYSNTAKADFLYVAVPVQIEDKFWIIRVSKQLVALQQINRHIINVGLLLMIAAAAIALVMSIVISKKITDPIDSLTTAANEIADGAYGKKIYLTGNDQIGALTIAFNKMSQNLGTSLDELKQRNLELEAILNSMINGIIAIDQNKNIILINKFCFEILDLPQDYVVENESMYKIIRNEEIAGLVEQAMTDGVSQTRELPYVHLDKVLRIYVNPILSSEREIMGSIVVIQDITQIRKLEQMRSDFVSNVSHELKTPLTSIRGFVDTLKSGAINQPEQALRFLDIIDIESDRLYRLINDILLLSEIESMNQEPEQTELDLADIVKEVFNILQQKSDEKNLRLVAKIDGSYKLIANRDRIKQMFINLVDNAIMYTEHGEITIEIQRQGDWTKCIVKDTGIGFSEIHKERLFERFYRADKGRSRNQGGTGLGLSIVKHIVLLYKGKISVESIPGMGSTFEILLPNTQRKYI